MTKEETRQYKMGWQEGIIEGITLYAIWHNGEQLVGCTEKPLKEVLEPYKQELARLRKLRPEKPATIHQERLNEAL
jgi:hypothetical protein